MMRKIYLFTILTCFLSLVFAQQNKGTDQASSTVSIAPSQPINFPIEALIAEKEGLAIYRIFLDQNNQYKSHQQLYATHQELADGIEGIIPRLQFDVSKQHTGNFHFVSPFIFELEEGEGETRTSKTLMQDGNACMQYGLSHMALHFYDQILSRRRKKDGGFFELHQARKVAFLEMNNWGDARQEVTNMLAYSREARSPYADQQITLRIERSVLGLMSEKSTNTISDLLWLNTNGACDISLLNNYIQGLHLTHKEALRLADEADKLQESLPKKTKFWLTAIAAVSLSHTHAQAEAHARFNELLEQEVNPAFQAGLMCQMGWSLYNQGKAIEALSQLEEVIHLAPDMGQAHFYKALSLAKLDYTTEAYESMRNALALGLPMDQQAQGQQMLSILAVTGRR